MHQILTGPYLSKLFVSIFHPEAWNNSFDMKQGIHVQIQDVKMLTFSRLV